MKYGLILGSPTIEGQMQTAARADAAGFESVWTTEFFNAHGLVRLAAVATATERVKLGTAIAYAFMRTPMLAASAAMDIDELSGGRMILGLGNQRMAHTALSYTGVARIPESCGDLRLEGLHAYVSNFRLGPEYTAQTRLFAGRLFWDIVYLDSDMDAAQAAAIGDHILQGSGATADTLTLSTPNQGSGAGEGRVSAHS